MTQLIDKLTLVAEIERRKYQFVSQAESFRKIGKEDKESYFAALASNMNSLLSFLDTIKTKEVDLEEAVDDAKDLAMRDMAWNVHVMISEGKSISEIDHYVCGICDF